MESQEDFVTSDYEDELAWLKEDDHVDIHHLISDIDLLGIVEVN